MSLSASPQLSLGMWLREGATFSNFITGQNSQLVAQLRQLGSEPSERFLYLWGSVGSGKSHLLQALCHQTTAAGRCAFYLPLSEASQLSPAMLEGLEQMALVVIDDVDAIAGEMAWEEALFHLYNRLRDCGQGVLVVAAQLPLATLALELADLHSRLAWGLVFQLQGLDDEDKRLALQQRAAGRGFELPDDVVTYLLRYYRRDVAGLFELLEQLDQASLANQRRLTIPFVKEVIAKHV